jgi:hypothetical protein
MPNIFDTISKLAFGVVTNTFGYTATWTPLADPLTTLTAEVGYGEPTEGMSYHVKSMLDDYNVYNYWLEYRLGDFTGLMESVGHGNSGNEEVVSVVSDTYPSGRSFLVQEVKAMVDGRSFKAKLSPIV